MFSDPAWAPPIVIGCIAHACTEVSYTASDRMSSISWYNGIWEGDWTIAAVLAMDNDVDKFGVESMLESILNNIYDSYIY